MHFSRVFAGLLPILLVYGANDWNNPCLDGQCSFDVRNSDGSVLATVDITGSSHAISDITPAAGWAILGCDPDAEEHDVRLICTSARSNDCKHLLQGGGPTGKIVRLPDSCGRGPFARIIDNWIPEDQSLPSEVETRIRRRGMPKPEVQGLRLDTKLTDIDSARFGPVYFSIRASTPYAKRESSIRERDDFDESVGSTMGSSLNDIFLAFTATLRCSTRDGDPISSAIDANFNANIGITLNVTVEAKGTLSPPAFTSFALNAGFNSNIDGGLVLGNTAITGDARTNVNRFFSNDLPALQIPGILTITPRFIFGASVQTQMRLGTLFRIGVVYPGISGHLSFPRSTGCSSLQVAPGDTTVGYSIASNFAPTSTLSNNIGYHFVPRLEFGLNAFSGATTSTIFLNLDASASSVLQLPPSSEGSTTATLNIKQGILAHAGAQGNFYGLFDDTTAFDVESKAWSVPTISATLRLRRRDLDDSSFHLEKRQASVPLTCVWPPQSSWTITSSTISAANFNSCGTVSACLP